MHVGGVLLTLTNTGPAGSKSTTGAPATQSVRPTTCRRHSWLSSAAVVLACNFSCLPKTCVGMFHHPAPTQHLPPGEHCPYFSHLSPNCCRATLSTCSTLPPYMRQWLRHCLTVLAGGIMGSMHVPMYSLCRHTPAAPRTSNRSVPQYHHSPSSDPSAMPLFCHTCPHGSTCAQAGREAGKAHNMMWQ